MKDTRHEHTHDESTNAASTRRDFLKGATAAAIGGAAASIAGPLTVASTSFASVTDPQDSYRTSWQAACTGGPVPPESSKHAVFRWLGSVNYEICYKGQIFLFSNYYDKGPDSMKGTWRYPYLGFSAKDVSRATAIFVGHAHFDHMSDTAQVAIQTGAPVYCEEIAETKLIEQGVDPQQIRRIANGDVFEFKGLTIEAVHMYHSSLFNTIMPDETVKEYKTLQSAEWAFPELSEEEKAAVSAVHDKGSWDKKIKEFGTFAYLFTFGKDFTAFMYDSHNPIPTEEFKTVMKRLGSVDIGTVGYQGGTAERLSEYVWPIVELYQAKFLWPTHNDVTVAGREHVATQHLAQMAKNAFPEKHTIISLYREPVTFDTEKHTRVSLDMV